MYSLVFVTEIYSTKVEKSAYKALINQLNLMNQPIIQKQQLNQPQKGVPSFHVQKLIHAFTPSWVGQMQL